MTKPEWWYELNRRMRRWGLWCLVFGPERFFWAWETVDGPVFWIYYRGFFYVCWDEEDGWSFGGLNID